MSKPESTTQADRLAAEIADAIIDGEWPPGAKLDEQGLADRYGVSRTPVREALRQLGASGLLEIRPRRGAIIRRMGARELEELFVAMGEIEATCARLSALGMSPIERRRLGALHDSMSDFARNNESAKYIAANDAFHGAIYTGAHNTVVAGIATGLRRRLAPFRRAQFRVEGRLTRSFAEHDVVVRAVLRGDANGAHAAMLHHVSLVENAFENLSPGFQ